MIFLMNLLSSEPSNKNWSPIPNNLQNLSWWKFRNLNFHIGISIISCPAIESADKANSVEPCKIDKASVDSGIEYVYLSSTNISLVLIKNSILIKPIVNRRDKVNVISKVPWPGGSGEKLGLLGHQVSATHFHIGSTIVFAY